MTLRQPMTLGFRSLPFHGFTPSTTNGHPLPTCSAACEADRVWAKSWSICGGDRATEVLPCVPVRRTLRPPHRHRLRSDQAETVRILYGGFRGSYHSGDSRDQLDHVDWIHSSLPPSVATRA